MSTSLLITAVLIGLAGSGHCAVMCGAPCAALTGTGRPRSGPDRPEGVPLRRRAASPSAGDAVLVARLVVTDARTLAFHAGRLTGYALAGAVAASLTGGLAWLAAQGAGWRSLWTLFHLGVLAWGLSLLVLAHQPQVAQAASLGLWRWVQPRLQTWVQVPPGLFLGGLLWVFMPCGLLWSALLVASLASSPWEGALAMALFAASSSLGLLLVPGLLKRLRTAGGGYDAWGVRIAGGLLVVMALAALWMALGQRLVDYCT